MFRKVNAKGDTLDVRQLRAIFELLGAPLSLHQAHAALLILDREQRASVRIDDLCDAICEPLAS